MDPDAKPANNAMSGLCISPLKGRDAFFLIEAVQEHAGTAMRRLYRAGGRLFSLDAAVAQSGRI